jgi:pilus assembly protein CpaB
VAGAPARAAPALGRSTAGGNRRGLRAERAADHTGGAALSAGDVTIERLPPADVPADALLAGHPVLGRLLAAPVRRGEPLTDVRLLSTSLLGALGTSGLVAVPVRVADAAATTALVQPGNRVDVLAADPGSGGSTSTVVRNVLVLAVPGRDDSGASGTDGLLVVAATSAQADDLARVALDRLSVVLRHPESPSDPGAGAAH